MPSSALKALALVAVSATLPSIANAAAALAPRASGTSTCAYQCKPVDDAGNLYRGPGNVGSPAYTGCGYYITVNGMTSSNNCVYTLADGKLAPGFTSTMPPFQCPAYMNLVCTSTPDRRDTNGVYKAYQERRERRAAMPAPSVPHHMATRASLKKRNAALEDLD